MPCRRSPSCRVRKAGCGRSIDFAARFRPRPISRSSSASTRSMTPISRESISAACASSATAPSRSASTTLRRFTERFAAYGFRPGAMAPVYGLAENAVAVTLPPPGACRSSTGSTGWRCSRAAIAEPARPDDPNAIELVACGQPIPDHEIRIIDDTGRELGERREGRLEFRGPSATSGYFQNAAKTRELFHDGWLDTGDRGYVAGGDLFITGRIKDIIIRAGQHIAPHEIEAGGRRGARHPQGRRGGLRRHRSGLRHRARGGAGGDRRDHIRAEPAALKAACPGGRDPYRRRPAGRGRPGAARHGAEDRQRQDPARRGTGPLSRKDT